MSKIIEVRRHFNLVEMSQEDPEVKAWLGESFKPIGPYFDGKVTATGLEFAEQKLLLPELLGIEYTDKDFRRSVMNHYDNLMYNIPKDGLKLEIGLEDDNLALGATLPDGSLNMPISIKDYLKYRHLVGHPHVAENQEEAQRGYIKKFYVHDPNKATAVALSINSLEDKAFELYMRFKDDTVKVDQILTMMGRNVDSLKKDKILVLKDFSKKSTKLSEAEQKESFQKFINICEDKDLEMKFLIQEGIAIQYLKRVGQSIVYSETGRQIGENMAEAVLYFKNPKYSRELNLLKAEYQTKSKKGTSYLPKEDIAELEAPTKKEKMKEVSKETV